jgi:hypothetical protein
VSQAIEQSGAIYAILIESLGGRACPVFTSCCTVRVPRQTGIAGQQCRGSILCDGGCYSRYLSYPGSPD